METKTGNQGIVGVVAALALLAAPAQSTTLGDLSRVTAKAVIVVDNTTDRVLFARNPHMQLPPASTTKLVTALVAANSGRLDRNVRVSKHASSMQPSKIWLQAGWTMNMHDLVDAMLIKSANDASVVVAEGLAGSVPSFAKRMNTTVQALGARNSNFVNPNGLPANGHYSSAADLAVVVRQAITVPELREIMSTRSKTIHPRAGSRRNIALHNTNKLLGKRPYKLIGKTGYTHRAKRCFAGAASLGGREVIVVVLGSTNLWGDIELLVDYGLQPASPGPDWSTETGWRQALAPKPEPKPEPQVAAVSKPAPRLNPQPRQVAKAVVEADPIAPPRVVAQGDRSRVTAEPLFRYHVQVAALRSRTLAQDLLRKVAKLGYHASIEQSEGGGDLRYRVIIRDLADRVIARRVARDLSRDLHLETQIVAVKG